MTTFFNPTSYHCSECSASSTVNMDSIHHEQNCSWSDAIWRCQVCLQWFRVTDKESHEVTCNPSFYPAAHVTGGSDITFVAGKIPITPEEAVDDAWEINRLHH